MTLCHILPERRGWVNRTYQCWLARKKNLHQLYAVTGCCLENLLIEMVGKRESSKSVLSTHLDDDDDIHSVYRMQPYWENLCSLMAEKLYYSLEVSSNSNYVPFWTHTFEKRYEPPYHPNYGSNSTKAVLQQGLLLALNNLQRLIFH